MSMTAQRSGESGNADYLLPENQYTRQSDYTPVPLAPEDIRNTYEDLEAGIISFRRNSVIRSELKNRRGAQGTPQSTARLGVPLLGALVTFGPWQNLLRHQFTLGVWKQACRIIGDVFTDENTDTGAISTYRESRPEKDFRGDLLEITEVFNTLTDPVFEFLLKQHWKPIGKLLPDNAKGPLWKMVELWDLPAYKRLVGFNYEQLSDNLAAIIMARLALPGKYQLFRGFVAGVGSTKDKHGMYFGHFRSDKLGKLAVMLSAMTRQKDLVRIAPNPFLGYRTTTLYGPMSDKQDCSLVDMMSHLGLSKRAQFFLEENADACRDYRANRLSEDEKRGKLFEFQYLTQLRLVEHDVSPRMGVPVIITEFEADTQETIEDLGPWKHDYFWKYDQLFPEQRPDLKQN
ncbi:hypothetical protein H4R33_001849 [Dimargaris cristalligena]|nr:hypothetical protein H4R33_001849 [Dimargaris cristalligena]